MHRNFKLIKILTHVGSHEGKLALMHVSKLFSSFFDDCQCLMHVSKLFSSFFDDFLDDDIDDVKNLFLGLWWWLE